MSCFVLHTSEIAHWHALVNEALAATHCSLSQAAESYLVFTLMRFTQRPVLGRRCLAAAYLEGLLKQGRDRQESLREVGDQCLILTGFFPEYARRDVVPVSYYVRLGQSAYRVLAVQDRLFSQLSQAFVSLMEVLQNIREMDEGRRCLGPLEAYELWLATGSRHAYRVLKEATTAVPASSMTYRAH